MVLPSLKGLRRSLLLHPCLLIRGTPALEGQLTIAYDCLCGAVGWAEMVSFDYLFWIVLLSADAVQRPNMVMSEARLFSFLRKKEMDPVCECFSVCAYTCL